MRGRMEGINGGGRWEDMGYEDGECGLKGVMMTTTMMIMMREAFYIRSNHLHGHIKHERNLFY